MDPRRIGIVAGLVVLVVAIVLFACSFSVVEPTEWGLAYNNLTKHLDKEEVYDGGRYCIGFTRSFIRFPKTQQSIEFSTQPWAVSAPLRTRTQEGLALGLHVNFQYRLIKEELGALYELSNVNFETTFTRIARDTILQEAGNYEAPEYWTNRTKIGLQMQKLLDSSLKEAHARCTGLQLLKITLPDSYEDSIVMTQVEVQKTSMKEFEQEAAIIRQETDVLISECNQNITVIEATANAEAYLIKEEAKAVARKRTLDMQAYVYAKAIDMLALNQTELAEYLKLTALSHNPDAKLLVNLGSSQPLININ